MFWFWRKNAVKNVINKETGKIEKLCVVCEKFSYYTEPWAKSKYLKTLDNVLCFDLNIKKYMDDSCSSDPYHKVYEQLKPIYQDFILAANQRFCSDCYWHIQTVHEYGAISRYYWNYLDTAGEDEEFEEGVKMTKTLLAASPFIFHAETDYCLVKSKTVTKI